ncbi:MAG TPA: universal stress protein [Caulobacteraceae bacterium]|jgi:nucleotide-binding universal stress UspA family protein|nr:universal stress protein [Caulobacteraceae bacterium]
MASVGTSWARIMVPVAGGDPDSRVLAAGAALASVFEAELAAVYAPADVADLMPWMGEGFMGGVQVTAVQSLKDAAAAGEQTARGIVEANPYAHITFTALTSPVWSGLSMEGRLSDVVVFDDATARGRGPLAQSFQQIVADEQRPTIVARQGLRADGCVAVAWDGGKEASRAMRTALPLLQKASEVVILAAPAAASRYFDPLRLKRFLEVRGVGAEIHTLNESGDVASMLLKAAVAVQADILVAGAFGHPRLQEFIFGGTTRSMLNAPKGSPSLFLSH